MKPATFVVVSAASIALAASGQACSSGAHFAESSGGSSTATATTDGRSDETGGAGGSEATTNTETSASVGGASGSGGSAPASCTGYEPCGVNPVVVPDGYTLSASISVFNQSTTTSCADFADCDMWNTHFDAMWNSPVNGWTRMGSPFPWRNSRYIFSVPPQRITYAKFHMTAPGEKYVYSDGTPEKYIDPDTHVATCYARGPGHLMLGDLGNLGGTGNAGFVDWNISVLPGDMGDSGNVSTCHGNGATFTLLVTSDESTAATKGPTGKFDHCLLREGADYYLNLMSHGKMYSVDCSAVDCTVGGFQFTNPTTSDGSDLTASVPCP